MITTAKAILWSQIPISIVILIGVYELYYCKKALIQILEKLAKKEQKRSNKDA